MKLYEKKLSSEQIFDGKVVKLFVDRVELPDGKEAIREIVRHPGAVCVIPVTDEGDVIMVKQYRYAFEQIMDDYNKDGRAVADIMDISAYTDEQIKKAVGENPAEEMLVKYAPYTVDRVKQTFTSAITGDGYVCLIDKYWYDILKDNNALVPLSEVLGYAPDAAIDDYSLYLKDLEFYKFFTDSVGKLPEDTIVCFRVMPATSSIIGRKEAKKMYGYSMKLFRAMIEFAPEG